MHAYSIFSNFKNIFEVKMWLQLLFLFIFLKVAMSLEKAPITPYGEEETYSSNPFAFCKNFLNFFNSTDFRTANSKYFTFHPKLKDLFFVEG